MVFTTVLHKCHSEEMGKLGRMLAARMIKVLAEEHILTYIGENIVMGIIILLFYLSMKNGNVLH
jgi:hypothetical protein